MNFNSLEAFKSNFKGGTRPNRFSVVATWPNNIGIDNPGEMINKTVFKIKATSIPESKLQNATVHYRGRPIYYATDRVYTSWSVTIIDDSESKNLWNIFQNWIEKIDGHQTHLYSGTNFDYSQHQAQFTLNQYAVNGSNTIGGSGIRTIILKNVWPVDIRPISLNMKDGNIVEFSVDLKFDYISFGGNDTINTATTL